MVSRKVLIFAGYFLPHIGGYGQSIYELSKRLVKKGYEIDIVTCNIENVSIYEELEGIHIHRLPSWDIFGGVYPIPMPTLTTLKILWKLLRKKHDLINTQTRFMITSFLGLVFAKIKRIPLIHTERGTKHSVVSDRIIDLISKTYDHTIGSLIVKSAWKNIGVSSAACDFLRHLGAKETTTIHNGIDANLFRKKNSNLREKTSFGNSVVITFVGRLIYAKGVHDLISVFADIDREFNSLELLIVGYGPYKQELEKLAEKTCKEKISFLGRKNRKEIAEILSVTDIFVNPSYSEGLPTSVLEASATGLPIVATDVGGTSEIIENYKTGLIVPPGDTKLLKEKISELIEDKDLRSVLGENAHKVTKEKFNWDVIAKKYEKIYGEVVERNTRTEVEE